MSGKVLLVKQTNKLSTALRVFKNGKFSIEQASYFANLSLYDFMKECKKNQISIISYDEDELENEMKLFSKINNFLNLEGFGKIEI